MFEKVMYKRLISHLNKYNILAKQQFGFRENFSTILTTYNLLDNIYMALNNECTVGGIFCDLKKAFDCVTHDVFLSKMEFYGITGIEQELMRFHVKERDQKVTFICQWK
jgi:hypothetical protein